jgi:hypothetical protein
MPQHVTTDDVTDSRRVSLTDKSKKYVTTAFDDTMLPLCTDISATFIASNLNRPCQLDSDDDDHIIVTPPSPSNNADVTMVTVSTCLDVDMNCERVTSGLSSYEVKSAGSGMMTPEGGYSGSEDNEDDRTLQGADSGIRLNGDYSDLDLNNISPTQLSQGIDFS